MKRFLCMSLILLSIVLSVNVSAAQSTIFYSKDYAQKMPQWNEATGAFAEQTPDGMRIGTKGNAAVLFDFPKLSDKSAMDWTGSRYVEINIINEKSFGMNLTAVIYENATGNSSQCEMYQIKNNCPAYIQDENGTVLKRTSYFNNIYIPGKFKGKLYYPLDSNYLETISWSKVDGKLDLAHIASISYYVQSTDASVIIGDVSKTDFDPAPLVQETTEATVNHTKNTWALLTTTNADSTQPTTAIATDGDNNTEKSGLNLWWYIGGSCCLVAVVGAAVLVMNKRKKKSN